MPAATPTNTVIVERLEGLRCDLAELSSQVAALAADERRSREDYLVNHAHVVNRADLANRRLDVLEPTVDAIKKLMADYGASLSKLIERVSILTVVLGFIAAGIGTWLITQILGLLE